jgi:hypothetical protein
MYEFTDNSYIDGIKWQRWHGFNEGDDEIV